ncbi:Tyrosine-protein kinase ptk [Jannaschia seosinensis]|uniref:Tyrosine-protein kinase ptk n=1 Tax=Jannaschia seosinensis TaxID=313367 RepID=A0A0M7BG22_9RHOB|nr:CpsD/CapB family tyrosine-protein kinase [Jannaschia seosinensis]CUH40853.1 Tyrosine-protein kinase ptk [Jannaschia seosinensis]
MEKLQRALQKAREQREGAAAPTPPDVSPAPNPGAGGPLLAQRRGGADPAGLSATAAANWNALREFVPDPDLLVRNRILTMYPNRDATAFDILRTKMRLLMERNGWSRIAVTSPTAGCGKTTIAANIAIGFGRQPDLHAMLFELDLRRPSLAKCLGLQPPNDVIRLMQGEVGAADQILRFGPNVAISASVKPSRDPTSILLDRRATRILAEIEEDFAPDLMLFDLPPLLVSDDSRAFLKEVDCVLIVAEAERTTVAQLDTCEREVLEHTNVLGTVLNQCRINTGKSVIGNYDYD